MANHDDENDFWNRFKNGFIDITNTIRGRPNARTILENSLQNEAFDEAQVAFYFSSQRDKVSDRNLFLGLGSLGTTVLFLPAAFVTLPLFIYSVKQRGDNPDTAAKEQARKLKNLYHKRRLKIKS